MAIYFASYIETAVKHFDTNLLRFQDLDEDGRMEEDEFVTNHVGCKTCNPLSYPNAPVFV